MKYVFSLSKARIVQAEAQLQKKAIELYCQTPTEPPAHTGAFLEGGYQVSFSCGSVSFSLFQVLLSQVHRLRALDLLGRFLDLGPWAVSLVRVFCLTWGREAEIGLSDTV